MAVAQVIRELAPQIVGSLWPAANVGFGRLEFGMFQIGTAPHKCFSWNIFGAKHEYLCKTPLIIRLWSCWTDLQSGGSADAKASNDQPNP